MRAIRTHKKGCLRLHLVFLRRGIHAELFLSRARVQVLIRGPPAWEVKHTKTTKAILGHLTRLTLSLTRQQEAN